VISRLEGRYQWVEPNAVEVTPAGAEWITFCLEVPERYLSVRYNHHLSFRVHPIFSEGSGYKLYGFLEELDHRLFQLLLRVSGVGPQTAMKIVGKNESAQQVIDFIAAGAGSKIAGTGKKTRDRIITDLRDAAKRMASAEAIPSLDQEIARDSIEGLAKLGWKKGDAKSAVEQAIEDGQTDPAQIIRTCLSNRAREFSDG